MSELERPKQTSRLPRAKRKRSIAAVGAARQADIAEGLSPGIAPVAPMAEAIAGASAALARQAEAAGAAIKRKRKSPAQPVRIHDYFDYRDYLRDVFEEKKRLNPQFSHRLFARQAGLASPSYLLMVINRERNLSLKSLRHFADGLRLRGRERKYFETLVQYDQADNLEVKCRSYSELLKLRAATGGLRELERERFEFLSKWHVVAIYVLIGLQGFRPDPEWISRRLFGKITPAQAKEALALLERLRLAEVEGGKWRQALGAITVKDDTRAMAVAQYHEALIKLAYEALKKMPIEAREMAGATISLPANRLGELKEKIRAFRKDLNSWASEFQDSDQVFQLNIQLFPLSEALESAATIPASILPEPKK